MMMDDLVAELLDRVKSRDPKTLHDLHDVISEEMDNYPQIDTLDLQMDVALEIISNFDLPF